MSSNVECSTVHCATFSDEEGDSEDEEQTARMAEQIRENERVIRARIALDKANGKKKQQLI